MAIWTPAAGDTIHIPSGPAGNHLFVILNDPTDISGYPSFVCALVSICTKYPDIPFDPTCVLTPGSHPFISHDSYISYRHTRLETQKTLIDMVAKGVFSLGQPFAEPIFS